MAFYDVTATLEIEFDRIVNFDFVVSWLNLMIFILLRLKETINYRLRTIERNNKHGSCTGQYLHKFIRLNLHGDRVLTCDLK